MTAPHISSIHLWLCFIVGMLLTAIPFPQWSAPVNLYEPEWVLLLLSLFTLWVPRQCGILTAFTLGLFLDVLRDTILGQHALALVCVSYVLLRFRLQIKNFPTIQIWLTIAGCIVLFEAIILVIDGFTGNRPILIERLATIFGSILVWPAIPPFLFFIFSKLRSH